MNTIFDPEFLKGKFGKSFELKHDLNANIVMHAEIPNFGEFTSVSRIQVHKGTKITPTGTSIDYGISFSLSMLSMPGEIAPFEKTVKFYTTLQHFSNAT